MDGDDDIDMFTNRGWYENPFPLRTVWEEHRQSTLSATKVGDVITSSGDIVACGFGRLLKFVNTQGSFSQFSIAENDGYESCSLKAKDVNLDGADDFIVSSGNGLEYFKNDGVGEFVLQQLVNFKSSPFDPSRTSNNINSISIDDIDGDGWPDIVRAHHNDFDDGIVEWYKYNPTTDIFGGAMKITDSHQRAYSLAVVDFNNNGFLDVVVWPQSGRTGTTVSLYENVGGDGSQWNETFLHGMPHDGTDVYGVAYDYDNDGDVDVFTSGVHDQHSFSVFHNLETNGWEAWTETRFSPHFDGATITLADLDNDGYLDIIQRTTEIYYEVSWWPTCTLPVQTHVVSFLIERIINLCRDQHKITRCSLGRENGRPTCCR